MHVVVPIAAGPTFEQTRRFAEVVATAVARAYPGEATAELAKRRRKGVFIDWKQNSVGASIVSPYSVRPVDGAPVSCPLEWDEVSEELDPRDLTMEAVLERVDTLGDVFAPALAGGQDLTRYLQP
jgi:bifunctional non-homologous end joining protein LigD